MIELGLLGLLSEQSLHGYELKKQLSELLGSWSLSFGSLYPALNRLERAELVRAVEPHELAETADPADAAEPSFPMTGALSGELAAFRQRLAHRSKPRSGGGRRARKVYGITDQGRQRLTELLTAPGPDDERTFSLRVAFCRYLDPAERLALFERRRAELVALLDRTGPPAGAERAGRGTGRRIDPYRRSLRERTARALHHDLDWLDELIEAARADQEMATGAPRRVAEMSAELASPSLSTLTTRPSDAEAVKEGSP